MDYIYIMPKILIKSREIPLQRTELLYTMPNLVCTLFLVNQRASKAVVASFLLFDAEDIVEEVTDAISCSSCHAAVEHHNRDGEQHPLS